MKTLGNEIHTAYRYIKLKGFSSMPLIASRLLIVLLISAGSVETTFSAADDSATIFKASYAQYQSAFSAGNFRQSLPLAEKSLELGRGIYGQESGSYAALHHNYGINLLRLGKFPEALSSLSETVKLYKAIYGNNAGELISLYMDLAEAKRGADYTSKWYSYHDDALKIAQAVYGKNTTEYALMLIDTGHLESVNQVAKGESRIRRGYKIMQELGLQHPRYSYANFVMGKIELSHGRYQDAISLLETSLIAESQQPAPDMSMLLAAHSFLANAYENIEQESLATQHISAIGQVKEQMGDTSAEPVFVVKPEFPRNIRLTSTGTNLNPQKQNQGSVTISFDVDKNGFTRNHNVDMATGPKPYINAAIEALQKFRYAPLFVNGEAQVQQNLRYQFKFILQD